jgi:hypothetical protein
MELDPVTMCAVAHADVENKNTQVGVDVQGSILKTALQLNVVETYWNPSRSSGLLCGCVSSLL